jgi:UDP-N-acetylglucosamine--N-acetylmuramyl-(pentapeptide) pyrophosphoryl-undecaprenol N-acetylglucosamine transferase
MEAGRYNSVDVRIFKFITRMDLAYAIADVVIARAGAITISEICLLGKPSILVPSPNVAEDHQTKNAMSLVKNNAALMIADKEAEKKLVPETIKLVSDVHLKNTFRENCLKMAVRNSAGMIADEIFRLANKSDK